MGAGGAQVAHTRQPTLLGTPAEARIVYCLQAGTTGWKDAHQKRGRNSPALGTRRCHCRHGRCCRRCHRTRAPRRCTRHRRWRPLRTPPQARPRRSRRPRWLHCRPPPATSTCPCSPPAHTGAVITCQRKTPSPTRQLRLAPWASEGGHPDVSHTSEVTQRKCCDLVDCMVPELTRAACAS